MSAMMVPEGWEVKRFGELAKINMGQSPDSEFVNEQRDGIAFLQGNAEFGAIHPSEKYWVTKPKKVAEAGEILVSVRAPVGEINRANQAYCIGRGLASLKVNKLDSEYGYFAFSRAKDQLNRLAQGSTFLAISKDDLNVISMLVPPKAEQQKIATILSTLDRTIEATQKLIYKEKMVKKGLMADLLTHGIDKQGRIRSPQTHTYVDSPLGMIPEGWEVKSIEKLILKVMDFRGKTPLKIGMDWGGGMIHSLSANNVQMGKINFDKETHLGSEELYETWMNKGDTKKDDIVFTMEAPLGNVALIPDSRKYILSQRVVLLRPNDYISPRYLFNYLMADFFQNTLLKYSSGSTVKGIQYSKLKQIEIRYPTKKTEQQKIDTILSAQDSKIQTEETNLAKLQNLKKGLMGDLLSGKIRT